MTSDCGAIGDIFNGHKYAPDGPHAAAEGVKAGTDVDCGGVYSSSLGQALNDSLIDQITVDKALTRLTRMQLKLGRSLVCLRFNYSNQSSNQLFSRFIIGLFDAKAQQKYFNYGIDKIDSKEHQQLALEAAQQSIVLLKNSHKTLPLMPGAKVAVIGPHANATEDLLSNYHGSRCVDNKFDCIESVHDAIAKANVGGQTVLAQGCSIAGKPNAAAMSAAISAAKASDHIILAVGLDQSQEREGLDRTIISLPGAQPQLVEAVLALKKSESYRAGFSPFYLLPMLIIFRIDPRCWSLFMGALFPWDHSKTLLRRLWMLFTEERWEPPRLLR